MSLNYRYRLKAIKIIGKGKNSASKETVSLVVKETVDIDIFITSANGDWKIMQAITLTGKLPMRIRKQN